MDYLTFSSGLEVKPSYDGIRLKNAESQEQLVSIILYVKNICHLVQAELLYTKQLVVKKFSAVGINFDMLHVFFVWSLLNKILLWFISVDFKIEAEVGGRL